MPPVERFSLPVARAFAALSQAAFCALAALTQGMWSSTIPVGCPCFMGFCMSFSFEELAVVFAKKFQWFLVRSYILVLDWYSDLCLMQFLRKPGGADETLRNWTCDACHAVGFTLAPGTTRLVRQAKRHAAMHGAGWEIPGCWNCLFFVFLKGSGMVKSKGTSFFCWVNGENLPA